MTSTTTSTAITTSGAGGCGCGGGGGIPPTGAAAFTRPRFFAGQLLTEDDLQQLDAYVTGKGRLRNRMLFGPGVVTGLQVDCAPCAGGGEVVVRPGYALDCCGNDIVVGCPQNVSITSLVNDLRARGLGVDCGDPCQGQQPGSTNAGSKNTGSARRYGLYVRYQEEDADLVAPYATTEPCPPQGCVPSRIRESFTFLVKCPPQAPPDHCYRPGPRLQAALGDPPGATPQFGITWSRGRRLDQYRERMRAAAAAAERVIVFTPEDAARFTSSRDELNVLLQKVRVRDQAGDLRQVGAPGADPGTVEVARLMTEAVRALAAAVARFDLYQDGDSQLRLRQLFPALGTETADQVGPARNRLEEACNWLKSTVNPPPAAERRTAATLPEIVWPDPVRRGIAHAVVNQTLNQVVHHETATAMEQRLVALGAPMDRPLRSDLRLHLGLVREWLLIRLESSPELTSCELRTSVAQLVVPDPLPPVAQGDNGTVSAQELMDLARLCDSVYSALYQFIADRACASMLPPPVTCTDTDVLLAVVDVDDCTVTRICSGAREQVLPGGAAYGGWLGQLPYLRDLTDAVCCQPVPKDSFSYASPLPPEIPGGSGNEHGHNEPTEQVVRQDSTSPRPGDGVSLPFVPGWLLFLTDASELAQLLNLLGVLIDPQVTVSVERAGTTTATAAPMLRPAAAAAGPAAERPDQTEMAELRRELAALTARLEAVETSAAAVRPTGGTPAKATARPAPRKQAPRKQAARKQPARKQPAQPEQQQPPEQKPGNENQEG